MPNPYQSVKQNLPLGRSDDIETACKLLSQPDCHILTLFGPGGIGKTILAGAIAAQQAELSGQSIYWLDLLSVSKSEDIPTSLLSLFGISTSPHIHPFEQIAAHLQGQPVLIVMDNFEHLIEGAELLSDLVARAPGSQLLVTSREVLNLQKEFRLQVIGLAYPQVNVDQLALPDEEKAMQYPAVQLFVRQARQQHPAFKPKADIGEIIRICQAVEGMPLALVLAATWTKLLTCEQIIEKLMDGHNLLSSKMRDAPDRHKSLEVVLDQTWGMLPPELQTAFSQLTVFPDNFDLDAALAIADVDLDMLSELIDKSIITQQPGGRFHIHGLLRHYGCRKLAEAGPENEQTWGRFTRYFVDYVYARKEEIITGDQVKAIADIDREILNIRAGVARIIERQDIIAIYRTLETLSHYCEQKGRLLANSKTLAEGIAAVRRNTGHPLAFSTLSMLLSYFGYTCIRLGRYGQARAAFEESDQINQEHDLTPEKGFGTDPKVSLAFLEEVLGNYHKAILMAIDASDACEDRHDHLNQQIALYTLVGAQFSLGQYDQAEVNCMRAIKLAQQTNTIWLLAYVLIIRGKIALEERRFPEARSCFNQAHEIMEETQNREGLAAVHSHLGRVALYQGEFTRMDNHYQRALTWYREVNDFGGIVNALFGTGYASLARPDEFEQGRSAFKDALEIACRIEWLPSLLTTLFGVHEIYRQIGEVDRAIDLLTRIMNHRATPNYLREMCQHRLDGFKAELSPSVFMAAQRIDTTGDLFHYAVGLQDDQNLWHAPPLDRHPTPIREMPGKTDRLIEPLTRRELEVLQLIASGRTNQQIADELVISIGTVKSYSSHIYAKLNVKRRVQAIARARELEII